MRQQSRPGVVSGLLALAALAACAPPTRPRAVEPAMAVEHSVVPAPEQIRMSGGAPFAITATTTIQVPAGNAEVARIAEELAGRLRTSTAFPVPVAVGDPGTAAGAIVFQLTGGSAMGEEGYRLEVTPERVLLAADQPAGLFRGLQTLRQLMPAGLEAELAVSRRGWTIPATVVVDRPRFAWRGSMLDVARHFLTVKEVKQYIDAMALYKLNVLHLHLSDDQGWRIEIRSRPYLTESGSTSQVGGGAGGFYTQADYTEIVRYAQERYITVVPEIDMPAHTNAALLAFPELSCGKRPPVLYTGTEVGFSALCPDREETYRLAEDIFRELAAITPGPYLHMGGDEVEALTHEQYVRFVERVQEIITRTGKRMVGWEEVAKARLLPTTLAQQWKSDSAAAAVTQGAKLIVSPASRAYLDMKYDQNTELGLTWAGVTDVRHAYDWNPATFTPGVAEVNIVGVEAPLWGETIENMSAAMYMAFPRLPAIAEIGWTPQAGRDWNHFRVRLAAQAPRWHILGINYYRSPQVPWTP